MVRYQIDPKIKVKKVEELLDAPLVVVVNEFNEKSAREFRDSFQRALNTNQPVVPVVIDSYGGQVYSLLSMIGTIKASPVPVATVITGKGMSCAAILGSMGQKGMRFMDPFATVMVHDVSSHAFGKIEEMRASTKEAERLSEWVFRLMSENCGHRANYFQDLITSYKNADAFLCADECKKHNLVDHIRVPAFTVKVETSINFG